MTSTAKRRTPRATAARQALRLCEAAAPHSAGRIQGGQHHISPATARAALRAVGLPPLAAAALRSRLRLLTEPEDTP
jgi:hypothetical protein